MTDPTILHTALAALGVSEDELEQAAAVVVDLVNRKAWRDAHAEGDAAADAIKTAADAEKLFRGGKP